MALPRFVREHPVLVYYLLTFLISWGGLVIIIGGPTAITSGEVDAPFLSLYFITVAGPSLTGFVLIGLYDGMKGYREFLSRLSKVRLNYKWYSAAILIAPLTVFASLLILSIWSPVFMPGILDPGPNQLSSLFGLPGDSKMTLVLFVFGLSLFNGFVEEVGWTGFLTPKLPAEHKLLARGFSLGMIWGLWHFMSNYLGSAQGAGSLPIPLFLAVTLFSFLPPFRILMTWVYDQTGSLFIAVIMHAALDFSWMLSMPNVLNGPQRVSWYLLWCAILWTVVILFKPMMNRRSLDQLSHSITKVSHSAFVAR